MYISKFGQRGKKILFSLSLRFSSPVTAPPPLVRSRRCGVLSQAEGSPRQSRSMPREL
ncbi:hypothetical protein LINPERPRIM_LOCUS5528 [Linum perenne]